MVYKMLTYKNPQDAQNSELHIDYILTESIEKNRKYIFDTPIKSDHLVSLVVTEIKLIKRKAKIKNCFDEKQYSSNNFVKTLSFPPWHFIYHFHMLSFFSTF